jgi:hypothetical protein
MESRWELIYFLLLQTIVGIPVRPSNVWHFWHFFDYAPRRRLKNASTLFPLAGLSDLFFGSNILVV